MSRKYIISIISVLLVMLLLTGCAKSMASEDSAVWDTAPSAPSDGNMGGDNMKGESMDDTTADAGSPEYDSLVNTTIKQSSLSEKIIYSASLELETVDFDGALEKLREVIAANGAFVENSYVMGNDYRSEFYGYKTYRYADFTIRVPVSNYGTIKGSISEVGNVTSTYEDMTNITTKFYDTEARRNVYEAEEKRLIEMLDKAETVADMIEVETRLAEVRYEIESLESTLRNWQNDVDYSTVNVHIQEVEELSERVETQRTYWQEITDGLKSTFRSIIRFFKNLFRDFIIALPILIIWAVVIAAAIVLIKFFWKHLKIKKIRKKLGKDQDSSKEE